MSAASGVAGAGRGWREHAACRAVDPELFFPAADEGPARRQQVAAAKQVCAGCPVRAECLEFALGALTYGIAGGLDEDERRAHRRSRPSAERPTRAGAA